MAVVTISLIVVNSLVFFYQLTLDPREMNAFVDQWGIVPDQFRLVSLFTSMFLHGGWLHLGGNMLFLWVFGRNLEDLIGGVRFLVFYIVCGLIAGVVQVIASSYSQVPVIGASGAIAGVMGAYLIKFPRARIVTLIFFLFIITVEIPAPFILLYWFATQFISGLESIGERDYTGGGVAVFAHIGGFIAGMLLIRLFQPQQRRFRNWYDEDQYRQ